MKKIIFFIISIFLLIGCSRTPELNDLYTYEAKEIDLNKKEPKQSSNEEENIDYGYDTITDTTITLNSFVKELKTIRIFFDFDKYNIKESEWPKVERLANLIKSYKANFIVRIEGNCDEWGTEEYNYALGLKRANSVKDALIKLGVEPKKLTVISYGELNPICLAHNEKCWAKNRRDDFTYLP